jgi:hypothetical protein
MGYRAVHRVRNLLAKLPERERERIRQAYWQALDEAINERDGKQRLKALVGELDKAGHTAAAKCLNDDLDALVVHLRHPLRHRRRWRSTNLLERSLGEVKRRTAGAGSCGIDRPGRTTQRDLIADDLISAWQLLDVRGGLIATPFVESAGALVARTSPQGGCAVPTFTHRKVQCVKQLATDRRAPARGSNEHHRNVATISHDWPGTVMSAIGLGKCHPDHPFVIARHHEIRRRLSELLLNARDPCRCRRQAPGFVRRPPHLQRIRSISWRRNSRCQHRAQATQGAASSPFRLVIRLLLMADSGTYITKVRDAPASHPGYRDDSHANCATRSEGAFPRYRSPCHQ